MFEEALEVLENDCEIKVYYIDLAGKTVTLKLADEDAAVVGRLMAAVSMTPDGASATAYEDWFRKIRKAHTTVQLSRLLEVGHSFTVAVRANQR